jgi:glycosyltransferase involved in cell wall biosynthesis
VRRVFVLSEAMRAELVAFYGFPEDRIDVVAPAVDARFTAPLEEDAVEAARDKYGLPETYLLYAGALQPRKNLDRLFEAYAKARREGAPARLVVAGRKAWMTDSLSQTLHRLELENDVVFTGYVDDPDLPALMRGARAFAYVSVYEGFGIPVIEAMACGTPVLTSGIGALAEVAGDGAATCDPLDVDAIAAGLTAVAGDETLRARLRLAGPRRAARYSHQAMADAAAAGYARALEGA